jgi:hypothetical protein
MDNKLTSYSQQVDCLIYFFGIIYLPLGIYFSEFPSLIQVYVNEKYNMQKISRTFEIAIEQLNNHSRMTE